MDERKLNIKITFEVTGKEGFKTTTEYIGTTMETVRLVENALLDAMKALNNG